MAWSSHRHSGIDMELFHEQKTWSFAVRLLPLSVISLIQFYFLISQLFLSRELSFLCLSVYTAYPSPPSVYPLSLLQFCAFRNSRYFLFAKSDPRLIWYVLTFLFLFSVIFFFYQIFVPFPSQFFSRCTCFCFFPSSFLAFISISSYNFKLFLVSCLSFCQHSLRFHKIKANSLATPTFFLNSVAVSIKIAVLGVLHLILSYSLSLKWRQQFSQNFRSTSTEGNGVTYQMTLTVYIVILSKV